MDKMKLATHMDRTITVRIPRVCNVQWDHELLGTHAGGGHGRLTSMKAEHGEAESPNDKNVWVVSIRVDKLLRELEMHLASGHRTVISRLLERLLFWYCFSKSALRLRPPGEDHPRIDKLVTNPGWGEHFHMDCQFVSLEEGEDESDA